MTDLTPSKRGWGENSGTWEDLAAHIQVLSGGGTWDLHKVSEKEEGNMEMTLVVWSWKVPSMENDYGFQV